MLVYVLGQAEELDHRLGLLGRIDFHDFLEACLSEVIVTLLVQVEPSSDSLPCL